MNNNQGLFVEPRIVYGYESPLCLEILASLVKALKKNRVLPRVELVKIGSYEYHIPYKSKFEYNEGGHHRLFAHCLLKMRMPYSLTEGYAIPDCKKIPISRLNVVSNWRLFMEHTKGREYLSPTLEDMSATIRMYNAQVDANQTGGGDRC